jgi:hypothetical protein
VCARYRRYSVTIWWCRRAWDTIHGTPSASSNCELG